MKCSVKVTVISVHEPCSAGLTEGRSFIIRDKGCLVLENADGICPELLNSVFPACMAYASGGSLPWEDEKGEAKIACPDPDSRVVVKLERLK
ncbi:MAG: TIGR04076 family protein [Bacillota bacterium]